MSSYWTLTVDYNGVTLKVPEGDGTENGVQGNYDNDEEYSRIYETISDTISTMLYCWDKEIDTWTYCDET